MDKMSPEMAARWQPATDAAAFVMSINGTGLTVTPTITVGEPVQLRGAAASFSVVGGGRVLIDRAEMGKQTASSIISHELGHGIEHHPDVMASAQAFVLAQAEAHPVEVQLARDVYTDDYSNKEHGRVAFATPQQHRDTAKTLGVASTYSVKVYSHGMTELLSTGIEALQYRPQAFARDAPAHFAWTVKTLRTKWKK
jgi:co-chaperonin GroES (HSP10)